MPRSCVDATLLSSWRFTAARIGRETPGGWYPAAPYLVRERHMTFSDEEFVPVKRRRAEAAKAAAAAASRRGAAGLANAAIEAVSRQTQADRDGNASFAGGSHFDGAARAGRGLAAPDAAGFGGQNGEKKSLLEEAAELESRFESRGTEHADSAVPGSKSAAEVAEQEAELLVEIGKRAALRPVAELAAGKTYTEPMRTTWRAPRYLLEAPEDHHAEVREKKHILVEGESIPPACVSFAEMKLPKPIMRELKRRGIKVPTPIQMQGLPVALSGRDMIGISFTGSGKTVVFVLPMLMVAWHMERQSPIRPGQGPSGVIICPSRELARQTFDVAMEFCASIANYTSKPSASERDRPRSGHDGTRGVQLRALLAIGGTQVDTSALRQGVHAVVATPGRLLDLLRKRRLDFERCKYVVLDEADRLIDLGFEEDVRAIFDFFSSQRQTVMFSATMPTKIQNFASTALVKPIVVNVGRAGAASLNIKQDVEVVRPDARVVRLLDVLQKTEPPVLIFCDNKSDVDEIHEYLLLKGVEADSIHGSKDQEERELAMRDFRSGKKHVLVATDVAAKGIDLVGIQHVINYDMPKEIENYVHRIGRTGRGGQRGLATTFILSGGCGADDGTTTVLADLLQLLVEAGQRVPEAMLELVPQDAAVSFADAAAAAALEVGGVRGCAYCGGLGHRVETCPRLQSEKMKALVGAAGGGGGGGGGGGPRSMADRGGTRAYGGEW